MGYVIDFVMNGSDKEIQNQNTTLEKEIIPLCQAETNHDAKLILVRAQNLPGQVHVMQIRFILESLFINGSNVGT